MSSDFKVSPPPPSSGGPERRQHLSYPILLSSALSAVADVATSERVRHFGKGVHLLPFRPSFLPSRAAAKWNERSERMDGMKDELPLTDSPSWWAPIYDVHFEGRGDVKKWLTFADK